MAGERSPRSCSLDRSPGPSRAEGPKLRELTGENSFGLLIRVNPRHPRLNSYLARQLSQIGRRTGEGSLHCGLRKGVLHSTRMWFCIFGQS